MATLSLLLLYSYTEYLVLSCNIWNRKMFYLPVELERSDRLWRRRTRTPSLRNSWLLVVDFEEIIQPLRTMVWDLNKQEKDYQFQTHSYRRSFSTLKRPLANIVWHHNQVFKLSKIWLWHHTMSVRDLTSVENGLLWKLGYKFIDNYSVAMAKL